MPRGYRCILVAFIGWLSLAATQHVTDQQSNAAETNQTDPAPPPYAPYGPLSTDACYRAQNHDTADLCAQWRAALAAERAAKAARDAVTWTIVGTIISVIALVALLMTIRQGQMSIRTAFSGLRQAGRQSRAAENALAETLRVNEVEMRPYLFIDRIEVTNNKTDFSRTYEATVFLKNFGRLPARNIAVRSHCYFATSLKRLKGVPKRATAIPVCAPGHERQYFNGVSLTRSQETEIEENLSGIVFRIVYSYDAGCEPIYHEAFDYIYTASSMERKLFFILSDESRRRRARLWKLMRSIKKRREAEEQELPFSE